jgi:hypothetical protein
MESSATKQAREKTFSSAVVPTPHRHIPQGPAPGVPITEKRQAGYGLPCLKCHAYYPADMQSCPICKSAERVTPTAPVLHSTAPTPPPETAAAIDEDRERFLKELKSQAFASHTQISAAATFRCVLEHQHTGTMEPAAVCHTCYGEARQQADRFEAALHMDARDAAKIVYDAVWADTSDPNATYLNAANALLGELRRRAGIDAVLGSNQPLSN